VCRNMWYLVSANFFFAVGSFLVFSVFQVKPFFFGETRFSNPGGEFNSKSARKKKMRTELLKQRKTEA
jgi:hypothetical protein